MNKVLIIAANKDIAVDYCKQKQIPKDQWRFISNMDQLRGIRDQEIILLPGYLDGMFFKSNGDRSIVATFEYRGLTVVHGGITGGTMEIFKYGDKG